MKAVIPAAILAVVLNAAPVHATEQFDRVLEQVQEDAETQANAPHKKHDDSRVSDQEMRALTRQMMKCWAIPAGAKDVKDMEVRLYVELARNGSLQQVALAEASKERYGKDPFYRAVADSAVRAVRTCGPYKLPPHKYEIWREMELNFVASNVLF